jgi:hypothetical protein
MVRTAICCDNLANLTRVRYGAGELIVGNNSDHNVLALKEKAPQDLVAQNQTTNDWHTKSVTLSEKKGPTAGG